MTAIGYEAPSAGGGSSRHVQVVGSDLMWTRLIGLGVFGMSVEYLHVLCSTGIRVGLGKE